MLTPLAHQLVRPESPGGCRGKESPTPTSLAYLRHSVDSSNAGPQRPRGPPSTQAPCMAEEFGAVIKRPQLPRVTGQEQGWPVASGGQLALPALSPPPQEQQPWPALC